MQVSHRLGTGSVGLLLLVAAVGADPVQPPASGSKSVLTTTLKPSEIDAYISQLGHKQFQKRREAVSVLEQLGPLVLPRLKLALQKATDPEVKRQLATLIPSLEQLQALEPTRLSLTCKDKPLKELVKEIEKQSSYKIELAGAKDEKFPVSVEWNKISFWDAMQSLSERCGLTMQEGWYGNDNMTVRLIQSDAVAAGFVHLDGPFRVSATGFNYYRNLQFNNRVQAQPSGATESLQLNMTVSVEPKMPLLSARQPIFTEATDDTGQNLLLPVNPQRNYYQHGYRSYMHQVSGQLRPSPSGRKLRTLKGTIPVTVVAETKPLITIDKLGEAKNKTVKQGTTTITIVELTQNQGQPGIKMSVTEGTANAPNDYTWMNSIQQRLEVFDEKGNKLQSYGGSWSMNGNNSLSGTFSYSGVPAKLVYYEWHVLSYQVPFSFSDLPLP